MHLPAHSLAIDIGERCRARLRELPVDDNDDDKNNNDPKHMEHWRIWFASIVAAVRERLQQQQQHTNTTTTTTTLRKVVAAPQPHDIVVHVRLGDVIDGSAYSVQELLAAPRPYYPNDNRTVYVQPFSYYDYHISDALLHAAPRVILVGAAHGGYAVRNTVPRTVKSCYYVRLLRDYFLQRGARQVELRLGGTPDEDVLYFSQASYFLPSGGGFARTVGWLIQELGGVVLGGVPNPYQSNNNNYLASKI